MFQIINLSSLIKNVDLRNKLIVLFSCLGIYKLGMHVYVPGINREVLSSMTQDSGMFSLMNTFTGGALSSFSIFAIGIMPYITASIIIQLLQMDVVPKLTEWSKEGESGKRKLKRLTYVLALVFAVIQAVFLSLGFNRMYPGLVVNPSVLSFVLIAGVLTLGTVILIVMGEVIDRKGIGKGISMIILGSILMTLPDNLAMYFDMEFSGVTGTIFLSVVKTLLLLAFVYLMLFSVIIINGGQRKIPVQSPATGQFGKMSANKSFLPIKINAAGVIPVIFASALFMMPVTLVGFFGEGKINSFIQSFLSYKSVTGILLYAVLIMLFTLFYSFIQINPETLANNLQSNNNFVPGIRPGKETEAYIKGLVGRLAFVGSIFLASIAVLPMILGRLVALPEQLIMSGASLIIIISVIVELKSQLGAMMIQSNYRTFKSNKTSDTLWAKTGK